MMRFIHTAALLLLFVSPAATGDTSDNIVRDVVRETLIVTVTLMRNPHISLPRLPQRKVQREQIQITAAENSHDVPLTPTRLQHGMSR